MKRALLVVVVAAIVLAGVVVIRSRGLSSRQPRVAPVPPLEIDAAGAVERLAEGLRIPTLSHQDPERMDREAFRALHRHLEHSFPRVHASLDRERVNELSLLYTWPGSEPELAPIVLMAHLDVVPVVPGTEADWEQPPFSGAISGGYVWGRGALDVKHKVYGTLEAVEALLEQGHRPRRTLLLAFGHDEEVGGREGAVRIVELLEARGVRPIFVVDEGGGIARGLVPGVRAPVALVGVAEKGYVSAALRVRGEGGHSSMPPPHTAAGILATALHRLEATPLPLRLTATQRRMLEYLAPEMEGGVRLAAANLWLSEPFLVRALARTPRGNATVRTTTAITMLEAGVKENVLPIEARAVANFRILPGESVESVLAHVREAVDDPRVVVEAIGRPNEPSAESPVPSEPFDLLQRTILELYPDAVVAPNLVLGGTDARYFQKLSSNVYRFAPISVEPEDLPRMHGTNERIGAEDYVRSVSFYARLVRNADELESQ